MGLPDLFRNEAVAKLMASKMGEVIKVEMVINGAQYIKFVRVYARIKIQKPLMRFVTGSVGPRKEPQKFHVLYEKMARFCAKCGIIGHIADQCGNGDHDPKKFQYGNFMMVPAEEMWFQPQKESVVRPGTSNMRGRGRNTRGRGGRSGTAPEAPQYMEEDIPDENLGDTHDKSSWKRLINTRDNQSNGKVPLLLTSASHVATVVENIENLAGKGGVETTPQNKQEKKRHKKTDADAPADDDIGSASSQVGVRQDQ
ncbi:hypothetical protein ACQ4PT_046655 [Festuca glaucescens]